MTDISVGNSRSRIRKPDSPSLKSVTSAAHYSGEAIIELAKARRPDPRLVSLKRLNAPEASLYHRLRHVVEGFKSGSRGNVIGITSPHAGEGKTFTAINLAAALAQDSKSRVLLVDLDLRQSAAGVKEYLGIRKFDTPGLVDWITDVKLNWETAAHFIPDYNLYLMPRGRGAESPYELLTSPRFEELLQEARKRYDYIILDTAAVLPVPDSQLISALIDGFMVVVAAKITSQKLLGDALNLLVPDKVLGLIYNKCSPADSDTRIS